MKNCLVLLLLFVPLILFAQKVNVSGRINDTSGQPLPGVNVIEKGTTNGTITNFEGMFVLSVESKASLVLSFIGYENQEITVQGRKNFDVVLKETSIGLDEVVAVGYGVQKKSDVTGATSSLGEAQIKKMPVKDALQAMQGQTAGVDITSNQRPGENSSIKIRGVRSLNADQNPLYVVDGMVIQTGGIDNINPNDIQSIDVLKDASATAIYGSRGANGEMLVTTKQGKTGKVTIQYSGTVTLEKMYDVTEMMSTSEWLDYARIAKYNNGTYNSATPNYVADEATWGTSVTSSFANIAKGWSNNNQTWNGKEAGGYDWASHGKQTGVSTEHVISGSGGSEKFKGYGSFGYLNQEGTVVDQIYKRYTAKTSFEANPSDWFKLGTNLNISYSDQDYGYSFTKSVTGAGDYYSALRSMLPWTVPYDENGNYIRNPANGDVNIINPINEIDNNTNERIQVRAIGSFFSEVDFSRFWTGLKGLKYRIQFGPEFRYYRVGSANNAAGINGDGSNKASYNNYQTTAWTLDNLVYYDKTIANRHKLGLTLMQSASEYHYETSSLSANVATADEYWYNMNSKGGVTGYGSGLVEKQMESYMIRGNYGYNDKYLLTASLRYDGASQLADGHKWASFPSLALAWRIEQEEFMSNLKVISNLKLRLGYGVTGNAAIDAYDTKGALMSNYYNWSTVNSSLGYVSSDPSARNPVPMANQDLSWERTSQYNLGIDFGVLNSRISGSIDIYKTRTEDLLMLKTIPSLTGYTSTWDNVGVTEGSGIDLQINTVNIKNENFIWTTNISWSKDKSEIVELVNGNTEDITNAWFVGKDINVYYDYVYDGIWKTSEATEAAKYGRKPGQIRVKDLNTDDKINANDDKQIVGKARPDCTGGITNIFNYKNLELSFFIYSRWGSTFRSGALTLDGRYQQRKIDYWVAGSNEDGYYYSPGSNGEGADTYSSSMNYQDGSFIKLRNINLGYNFGPKALKKMGLNSLKVYAQCMNPWMIYSKCDYLDTDLSNYDNNSTSVGSPTTTRGFVFGVNVGF